MPNYNIEINASEDTVEQILKDNCKKFLGLRFVDNQIQTPAGIIDILARHPQSGTYFVVEIKKDTLDTHALAQVLKYTKFMNTNKTKGGKRLFVPLLVGRHLSEELNKCVYHYESDDGHSAHDIYYTLYGFDLMEGLLFNYYASSQIEYQSQHFYKTEHYCDTQICDVIDTNFLMRRENDKLKSELFTKTNGAIN